MHKYVKNENSKIINNKHEKNKIILTLNTNKKVSTLFYYFLILVICKMYNQERRMINIENVREQINTGYFNKPSEFASPQGGLLKTAWIYEPDGTLSV